MTRANKTPSEYLFSLFLDKSDPKKVTDEEYFKLIGSFLNELNYINYTYGQWGHGSSGESEKIILTLLKEPFLTQKFNPSQQEKILRWFFDQRFQHILTHLQNCASRSETPTELYADKEEKEENVRCASELLINLHSWLNETTGLMGYFISLNPGKRYRPTIGQYNHHFFGLIKNIHNDLRWSLYRLIKAISPIERMTRDTLVKALQKIVVLGFSKKAGRNQYVFFNHCRDLIRLLFIYLQTVPNLNIHTQSNAKTRQLMCNQSENLDECSLVLAQRNAHSCEKLFGLLAQLTDPAFRCIDTAPRYIAGIICDMAPLCQGNPRFSFKILDAYLTRHDQDVELVKEVFLALSYNAIAESQNYELDQNSGLYQLDQTEQSQKINPRPNEIKKEVFFTLPYNSTAESQDYKPDETGAPYQLHQPEQSQKINPHPNNIKIAPKNQSWQKIGLYVFGALGLAALIYLSIQTLGVLPAAIAIGIALKPLWIASATVAGISLGGGAVYDAKPRRQLGAFLTKIGRFVQSLWKNTPTQISTTNAQLPAVVRNKYHACDIAAQPDLTEPEPGTSSATETMTPDKTTSDSGIASSAASPEPSTSSATEAMTPDETTSDSGIASSATSPEPDNLPGAAEGLKPAPSDQPVLDLCATGDHHKRSVEVKVSTNRFAALRGWKKSDVPATIHEEDEDCEEEFSCAR